MFFDFFFSFSSFSFGSFDFPEGFGINADVEADIFFLEEFVDFAAVVSIVNKEGFSFFLTFKVDSSEISAVEFYGEDVDL